MSHLWAAKNLKNKDSFVFKAAFLAMLTLFFPETAWADGTTLGNILCNVAKDFTPLAPLMSAFAYIAGAVLVIKGTMLFKKHTDNPNDSQIVKAIAHCLGGGTLAVLPAAVRTFQETLHISLGGSTGISSCTAGSVTSGGTGPLGLDMMMENFVKNIEKPMVWLVSIIGILVGIFYIYKGLLAASKTGTDPRASAPHVILVYLIVGAVLVSLGSMLGPVLTTVFGDNSIRSVNAIINWEGIVGSGADVERMNRTVWAMLTFVKVIGVISFLRGWMILKKAVEGGQATIPQALSHIIGGAMAINIGTMLEVFDRTFGTGLVNS